MMTRSAPANMPVRSIEAWSGITTALERAACDIWHWYRAHCSANEAYRDLGLVELHYLGHGNVVVASKGRM